MMISILMVTIAQFIMMLQLTGIHLIIFLLMRGLAPVFDLL